jgi:hypothetical protein
MCQRQRISSSSSSSRDRFHSRSRAELPQIHGITIRSSGGSSSSRSSIAPRASSDPASSPSMAPSATSATNQCSCLWWSTYRPRRAPIRGTRSGTTRAALHARGTRTSSTVSARGERRQQQEAVVLRGGEGRGAGCRPAEGGEEGAAGELVRTTLPLDTLNKDPHTSHTRTFRLCHGSLCTCAHRQRRNCKLLLHVSYSPRAMPRARAVV